MTQLNFATRKDFILLFDVLDGNPNGDPDAGNSPRVDTETGQGLVTDVCIKRKIRNFVSLTKNHQKPYNIFVKEKAVLNNEIERIYTENKLELSGKKGTETSVLSARQKMCEEFYDIRTFGGVLSTGFNAGQVKGPIQLTFGRSIDPIFESEHTITRMAVATQAEAENQNGDNRTMGRKHTIPYGLYKMNGFYSANFAKQTKFSQADFDLFISALRGMFDHDRSAARGLMTLRAIIMFEHTNELGNKSAGQLFETVSITKKSEKPTRSIRDYLIEYNGKDISQELQKDVLYTIQLTD